jgi:hypothetical protein
VPFKDAALFNRCYGLDLEQEIRLGQRLHAYPDRGRQTVRGELLACAPVI